MDASAGLADRLADLFAAGGFETMLVATLAGWLLLGVLGVLWYGYVSRYVYPEIRPTRRR